MVVGAHRGTTLTRATKTLTRCIKIMTSVEATMAVDMVETTTVVEDQDIQSRVIKAPARRTQMMTMVEEAATGKVIPTRATKIQTRGTKMMITGKRTPTHVQAHGNAVRHVEINILMSNKFVMVVATTCVTPTTLTIGLEYKLPSRLRSQPMHDGATMHGVTTDGMVETLGAVVRGTASGEVMVHAARRLTHVLLVSLSRQTR
mmetsp:Transcript_16094/g.24048  ORF Transcript_16094/g.24048 Transcript_16094/m.24048 type:complete len:203 (+) Transcript_16094:223-831(+)